MQTVNVYEIQEKLNELLVSVKCGNEIILTQNGTPVARLAPIITKPQKRELGFVSGVLPDSFFDPLPEEEIQAWGL